MVSSLINTSQGFKIIGAKVNIDLEQLELLRAFQVCAALLSGYLHTNNSNNNRGVYHTANYCNSTRIE